MKYMYNKNTGEMDTSHLSTMDTHCCTLTVYLLLLIFSCLLIFLTRDVQDQFWNNQSVHNIFKKDFNKIEGVSDVYNFLDLIGNNILLSSNTSIQAPELR